MKHTLLSASLSRRGSSFFEQAAIALLSGAVFACVRAWDEAPDERLDHWLLLKWSFNNDKTRRAEFFLLLFLVGSPGFSVTTSSQSSSGKAPLKLCTRAIAGRVGLKNPRSGKT